MYGNKNQQIGNLFGQLRYQQRYLAEQQVKQLIHQINSLQPSKGVFVANNGNQETLLKLEGTIPITFQFRQYNIPMCIWLPLTFPMVSPRCFVTPVQGMRIKPKHILVDTQGFVYHPYLSNWNTNNGSNLAGLIGVLSSEFGKNPPVYSGPVQQPRNIQSSYVKPQPRPQPIQNQWGQQPINRSNTFQPQMNQYQPQNNNYLNKSMSMQNRSSGLYNNNNNNYNNYNNNNNNFNNNNNKFNNNQNNNFINNNISQNNNNNSNKNNNNISNNSNVSSDVKNQFANKVKPHLRNVYDELNRDMKNLASKRKEIEEHASQMDKIEEDIRKEKELLINRKKELSDKIQYLEKWLEENESNDTININEVVTPSDLWSQQCIEATSKDHGATDTLLELDKALDDGSIKTVDLYLKQIRKVAREQFMQRALAKHVFEKQDNMVKQNRNRRG